MRVKVGSRRRCVRTRIRPRSWTWRRHDLTAVFAALDAQFPGIRFRVIDERGQVRKHMKVFVNDEAVRDLSVTVRPSDEVTIMQALSGG